ncbi:hypothetical protein MWU75_08685 [Ornithinimicrobium sp. F0845]|uniref:hypothetical protein n=1 Tax=Ornithinimicrobium sp. F0845 TaxID=2926412 RepID=UPI001FF3AFF9|nr:hypothetical protein [Ornithinimicrobium sp. F0845]MCK0112211.1 hypothetical protein [Ornithinimicrobium sp. F0845]
MSDARAEFRGGRPARRTVVRGAAWAVPAIVVASASPVFAASGECLISSVTPEAVDQLTDTQVLVGFEPAAPAGMTASVSLEREGVVHRYTPIAGTADSVTINVLQGTLDTGVYDVRLEFTDGTTTISCTRVGVVTVTSTFKIRTMSPTLIPNDITIAITIVTTDIAATQTVTAVLFTLDGTVVSLPPDPSPISDRIPVTIHRHQLAPGVHDVSVVTVNGALTTTAVFVDGLTVVA